jgi:acetate kinase
VAFPDDDVSLLGALEAARQRLIVPVLVGPRSRILAVAQSTGQDISAFRIVKADSRICEALAWMGLSIDAAANDRAGTRISAADSRVSAWVVPTDEDLVIARHTRELVGDP